MNTQEIANQLVDFCRKGDYGSAHKELFAPDAISAEPNETAENWAVGLEAITQKGEQWAASVEEVHGSEWSDPIVAGNHFSVSMMMDATFKGRGRNKMEEICVFETKDGKIVKEQFFYEMPPQQ